MPRILLVDKQPVIRRGIRATLCEGIEDCVFGEAGTGADALGLAKEQAWDLIIMQINLPDVQWVDFIRRMRLVSPKTPLLVFCRYPEEHYGTRCIKLGAAGYLAKDTGLEALVDAVQQVLSKGIFISAKVAEKLAREASHPLSSEPHETLSNREYEIFRMLTSGMTVTEIGDKLKLSVKTVSTYRKRILDKMGMQSNADLTNYAASIGMLY